MKFSAGALVTALVVSPSVVSAYYDNGWKPGQAASKRKFTGRTGSGGWSPNGYQASNSHIPSSVQLQFDGEENTPEPIVEEPFVPGPPIVGLKAVDELIERVNGGIKKSWGYDFLSIYRERELLGNYQPELDTEDGVIRLTDDNYKELFEDEELTKEELKDRVWCIIIHGAKSDPMTAPFFDAHANASRSVVEFANNGTQDPLDLSHVKFARIDYTNVSWITTKWLVFKPPYIVFASHHGDRLSFLPPRMIRPDSNLLREVLANGEWKHAPRWRGSRVFTPWFLDKMGRFFYQWNHYAGKLPKVFWLMASGAVSQFMLSFMHKKSNDKDAAKKPKPVLPPAPASAAEKEKVAEAVKAKSYAAAAAPTPTQVDEEVVTAPVTPVTPTPASGKKGKKGGKK